MHKNFCIYFFPLVVALSLSWIAIERTDFSYEKIASPLLDDGKEVEDSVVLQQLQQPFHFLGKGRQSFVFASEDGRVVLKFFNQKYFQVPWYAFAMPKEPKKRRQREFFYYNSYPLAEKFLSNETAIVYSHYGKTKSLPDVKVVDRAHRTFTLRLNEIPFVLQKRGEPFYPCLEAIQKNQGKEAFLSALSAFLEMIAHRISLGIGDADHDVEHNFGFLEGKPFHIDPGRLYLCDFSERERLEHEWWRATHAMRKWLSIKYPEVLPSFDEKVKELQ